MEKIKKRIANLKVAGKLKLYRMTVLVMTLFLVLVALISTVVIRSNILIYLVFVLIIKELKSIFAKN